MESSRPSGTLDPSEIEDSLRWVDPVLGASSTAIRLMILDEGGRLRVAFEQGNDDLGGNRSLRRRETITSERPRLIHLRRTPGGSLAILPLVYRGEVRGVLEIEAADHVIGERLAALEAAGAQMAVVLNDMGVMSTSRQLAEATDQVPGLLQDLLAAVSREHTVGTVVRFCWERVGAPAVGLLRASDGHGFRLVASRGIDRETKEMLRRGADTHDTEAMVMSAGHILPGAQQIVSRSGDAVVLVNDPAADPGLLETVEAGLGLALDRITLSDAVADLAGSMDAGLAWTAHELRAPLLGVEKAIDIVATHDGVPDRERQILEGAHTELRRLTGVVEDVLRWSVGAASIRRRPTDLSRLVEETARSVSVLEDGRRLTVDAPQTAMVHVDPHLLRIAVENLLRNSLQHARDAVDVTVGLTTREASVSVSDIGPGVPTDQRATIFEPFVRGSNAAKGGRGLGLFIARRVVQAHGGALWYEAAADGSIFRMRFPRDAA